MTHAGDFVQACHCLLETPEIEAGLIATRQYIGTILSIPLWQEVGNQVVFAETCLTSIPLNPQHIAAAQHGVKRYKLFRWLKLEISRFWQCVYVEPILVVWSDTLKSWLSFNGHHRLWCLQTLHVRSVLCHSLPASVSIAVDKSFQQPFDCYDYSHIFGMSAFDKRSKPKMLPDKFSL